MSQAEPTPVRMKVSPEIARIVQPGAPRDAQLAAARGALRLAGKDLLTVLFFLCRSEDGEIRQAAVKTLRAVPAEVLAPVLEDEALPPQLLDLLVRARMADTALMASVIEHPATALKTLLYLAGKGVKEVLWQLSTRRELLQSSPELVKAIIDNPAADQELIVMMGGRGQVNGGLAEAAQEPLPEETAAGQDAPEEDEGRSQTEIESLMAEADREGLSKYQIALELKVAEKIKMGLTGDKEWRNILIKEANKLVQGAVMKNPRISDGEVLMVAKNKTSSDEIVRAILLNKDWLKNYEIRKALVIHPKTPLPRALRFVSSLSMKDIKDLARSRQVSNIIATAARKELELRLKKSGG